MCDITQRDTLNTFPFNFQYTNFSIIKKTTKFSSLQFSFSSNHFHVFLKHNFSFHFQFSFFFFLSLTFSIFFLLIIYSWHIFFFTIYKVWDEFWKFVWIWDEKISSISILILSSINHNFYFYFYGLNFCTKNWCKKKVLAEMMSIKVFVSLSVGLVKFYVEVNDIWKW